MLSFVKFKDFNEQVVVRIVAIHSIAFKKNDPIYWTLSIWNENHFSDFFNSIVDYLEEDWAWYKILNGNLDHVAHTWRKKNLFAALDLNECLTQIK